MTNTHTHPQKNWRFRVSKLGALTEGGEFEIKPLTLFCGENNTGKTWAMYATYGFLHLVSMPPSGLLQDFFSENNTQKRFPYKAWLEKKLDSIIARGNKGMSNGLHALFNADKELLEGAEIEWIPDKKLLIESAIRNGWKRVFKSSDGTFTASKAPNAEDVEIVSTGKIDMDFIQRAFPMLSTLIDCKRAFLMPAERCGLHLFYRELSSQRAALLHHAGKKEIDLGELLHDVMQSRYAVPIAHYIDWLNKVSSKNTRTQYSDIAQLLAKKVAGGKYRVSRQGEIFFTPRKIKGTNNAEMGLHTTSSTVKSMFGLWYYLQREAQPGDVLMIDEPELNLHPDNQRVLSRFLARILAQAAKRGLYVVASTHSDYIIREINTLMILSKQHPDRASLMKKYGIDESETISPELVGAYVMKNEGGRKGGVISQMEIDDEGINAKTLDDVISSQNKASNDVYFGYQDRQDGQ